MAKATRYSRLDPGKITSTLDSLHKRIVARFETKTREKPRGLTKVAGELLQLAIQAETNVAALARPNRLLQLVPVLLTGMIAYITWMLATNIDQRLASLDETLAADIRKLIAVLREIKSDITLPIVLAVPIPLVVAGFAAIWSLEARWKRKRTLEYLHELRSIIHVIDMHQLTKDPRHVPDGNDREFIGGVDLVYYLDYCAELLSLAGKVAALYAESTQDAVVIEAVSDLGEITANLSNKIWQKLDVVERDLPAPVRAIAMAGA